MVDKDVEGAGQDVHDGSAGSDALAVCLDGVVVLVKGKLHLAGLQQVGVATLEMLAVLSGEKERECGRSAYRSAGVADVEEPIGGVGIGCDLKADP